MEIINGGLEYIWVELDVEKSISAYDSVEVEGDVVDREMIRVDVEDENVWFFGKDVRSVRLGYNNGLAFILDVFIQISS